MSTQKKQQSTKMQFSKAAVMAALVGMSSAQMVHVVSVSTPNNTLIFSPNNLKANAGDMVQFQFLAGNHSVAQSNFDNPCTPIADHVANVTGMFSGYMPVSAGMSTGNMPLYTMMIADTKPVWLYCSQGKHCQAGMVMVINENTAANSSRSLEAFKSLAKQAPENVTPTGGATSGGSGGSSSGGSNSGSNSGSGTGTTSGSGSASSTPAIALGSVATASAWTGLLSVAVAAYMLL
ncbi:Cupredoxin [Xylariaceae sp. FL1651]|nr:Cupredoxin [Xylariaceae sp. FL1651]